MNERKGTLLVTGASRGIGAATCRLAAAAGYAVAINYRSEEERAEALCRELRDAGARAATVAGDVANEAEVVALFDAAQSALGPLAGLVNNAGGVGTASRFLNSEPETWRRVMDVNVLGLMLCTREAIARMARSRGGQGGGIVNLSSVAATIGSSGEFVWYAASKAAVDTFTLGVAREVAEEGIRVNAVAPGIIDTEIHARSGAAERVARLLPGVPMKRSGTAEEVAEAILFLLSDKASYITGAVLRVGGGR